MDYRKVYNVISKDTYPLPPIDDTLDAIRGSHYFSTLYLYSGYRQVKMDPRDIDITASITRQGLFHFTLMFVQCISNVRLVHGTCSLRA